MSESDPQRNDARRKVVAQVARAVAESDLWQPRAPLIVAVSGGADSLCLLGALLDLREVGDTRAPGELIVATLDHGLRGAAGAEDARWVAALAEALGLRCYSQSVDTRALAEEQHLSLEQAARRLRYAFLGAVARETNAARICVAHTQDDQAETLLLHLLRGSGLNGLSGMRPLNNDIARPLLGVTRARTEAYCKARGWLPREDASNLDERYTRNGIRHSLLPMLATYNPQIRSALARTAASLAEDADLLASVTGEAWDEAVRQSEPGKVTLDLATLQAAHPALRVRLIQRAVAWEWASDLSPNLSDGRGEALSDLEGRHIRLIQRLITTGTTGTTLELADGLRVTRDYDTLRFSREASAAASQAAGEWRLDAPGVVVVDALGWRVRAAISELPAGLEGNLVPPPPDLAPIIHAGGVAPLPRGEWRVYLDADAVGSRLSVRAWRPGDRMRPLGMAHSKKLQDIFADAKVPRAIRRTLPVVCAGERIIWVVGVRVSDEHKLTETTKRILVLQAEPLDELVE